MFYCHCAECGIKKVKFVGKLVGPCHGAGIMTDEIFKGVAKGAYTLGKHGLSQATRSPLAKQGARRLSGKYIDQALDDLCQKMSGGSKGGCTRYSKTVGNNLDAVCSCMLKDVNRQQLEKLTRDQLKTSSFHHHQSSGTNHKVHQCPVSLEQMNRQQLWDYGREHNLIMFYPDYRRLKFGNAPRKR